MGQMVDDISISANGFSAGHNQTEDYPFGDGDTSMLHAWMFDRPHENVSELSSLRPLEGTMVHDYG
jgi:hypothetical protein